MLLFLNRIRQPVELVDEIAHVVCPHALGHPVRHRPELAEHFVQRLLSGPGENDIGAAPVRLVHLPPQQAALLQMAEGARGGRRGTAHIVGQS